MERCDEIQFLAQSIRIAHGKKVLGAHEVQINVLSTPFFNELGVHLSHALSSLFLINFGAVRARPGISHTAHELLICISQYVDAFGAVKIEFWG